LVDLTVGGFSFAELLNGHVSFEAGRSDSTSTSEMNEFRFGFLEPTFVLSGLFLKKLHFAGRPLQFRMLAQIKSRQGREHVSRNLRVRGLIAYFDKVRLTQRFHSERTRQFADGALDLFGSSSCRRA